MYKNKTQKQWTAFISFITWESQYLEIMKRLYPNSAIEKLDPNGKTGTQLYSELMPYQMSGSEKIYNTRLPFSSVKSEVQKYIDDLTTKSNHAFRLIALYDWKAAAGGDGFDLPFNDLVDTLAGEIDDTTLQAIEATDAPSMAGHIFEMGVAEKESRIRLGQKCVATVNYMNDQNWITSAQVIAILGDSDIQNVMNALSTGSLNTAKALIAAKDLTSLSPMDETYKTKITGMINDYLGA